MFEEIGKFVGGLGVCVAALTWLAHKAIDRFLSRDLEQHKSNLEHQNHLAAERLRAELARQAVEHETRFRRVDDKVAEHLVEAHKLVHCLYKNAYNLAKELYSSSATPKDELFQNCIKANHAFNDFYFPNRCYIPPGLDVHIKRVTDKLADIVIDWKESQNMNRPQSVDYWGRAWRAADKDATPLMAHLVKAIRMRLGVVDLPGELELLIALPEIKPEEDDDE